MKLSIVIPVYNEPRVGRALESILSQEGVDPEILVIDGGSGPETQEVLARHAKDIDVLVSEKDRGVYDAMNKGVARATGDVIGILSANDVYADTRALADVMAAFAPDVDACYGDVVYVNAEGDVVRYWRSGEIRRAKFYTGWMPAHPTFFVRRELYERHGRFDMSFGVAADYELTLRFLLRHQARARYVPRVLVKMSTGGLSTRPRLVLRSNLHAGRAWRANGLRGGFLVPVLKPLQKVAQFVRRPKRQPRTT